MLHKIFHVFNDINFNENFFSDSYEINLAATDSPLTIIKHYQPVPSPTAHSGGNYQTLRVSKLSGRAINVAVIVTCAPSLLETWSNLGIRLHHVH